MHLYLYVRPSLARTIHGWFYIRVMIFYGNNKNDRSNTSQAPFGHRGAGVGSLNLVEEQVDFLLHAQHVRGLALFDLLV